VFDGNVTFTNSNNATASNLLITDSLLQSSVILENVTMFNFLNSTLDGDFSMDDCSSWLVDGCDVNLNGRDFNVSGYIDDITVTNCLIRVNNETRLGGTIDGISNINFTHNAYSPYFDLLTELSKSDYAEGSILPEPVEFFGIFNDTTPFYSVTLFGYWPLKPIAHFRVSHVSTVILVAEKSYAFVFDGSAGDPSTTFLWQFGDGTNSTLQNPSHVFVVKGSYVITLTVTDGNGDTSTVSVIYKVLPSGSTGNENTPEILPLSTVGFTEGLIIFVIIAVMIFAVTILLTRGKKMKLPKLKVKKFRKLKIKF
jgi:hypothetical protein